MGVAPTSPSLTDRHDDRIADLSRFCERGGINRFREPGSLDRTPAQDGATLAPAFVCLGATATPIRIPPSHLLQYGPPREIYERPASRFVADFIGQTSFLAATVESVDDGHARARLHSTGKVMTATLTESQPRQGDGVLLAIRSERIEVQPGGAPPGAGDRENTIAATIKSFVYVGSAYEYILETPEGEIRVATPQAITGSEVALYLPPDSIVVLPDEPAAAPAAVD
jgi:ABC-type sugar transport system ATPase subunit